MLSLALREAGLIVHEFDHAETFLQEFLSHSPAVIVSDMVLPGISGIELFESLRARGHETPVIFMSGYSEPHQIIEGMKLGVVDFLWKPFIAHDLLGAVMHALRLDRERTLALVQQSDLRVRWQSLSEREKEVCRLMLLGHGNKDISVKLGIQPDTANKHRMKVLKKMGVAARPQLLVLLQDFEDARM